MPTERHEDTLEPLLTVREIAAYEKRSTAAVYRDIEAGLLPAIRYGSSIRVERSALAAYRASRRTVPVA